MFYTAQLSQHTEPNVCYAELASSSDKSPTSANEAQDCEVTAVVKGVAAQTSDEELDEDVLK